MRYEHTKQKLLFVIEKKESKKNKGKYLYFHISRDMQV